ncbi:MAG: arginine decarboxylase, pyruvoyl-dependent [Candidatus Thermoplasmatota archaeon]
MGFIPKKFFLTTGKGTHRYELQSFELALRDAGIEKCNLVKVSSIIPPECKQIERKIGINKIKPGQITYVVLSMNKTKEVEQTIGASIGIAKPSNKEKHGYIAEYRSIDESKDKIEKKARKIATTMLNTLQEKDLEKDEIVTKSVSQTGKNIKPKFWHTVLAAAVFVE